MHAPLIYKSFDVSKRTANKVLLIGWDAADWQMIRPLIDRGMMPTLAKLIEGGVSGNLATIQPILSPMLWNSIATGKRADKHGICGFVEPTPDHTGIRPVSSTSRKCKAIWNILSRAGMTSNVVSWFASHPAEPIRGTVVTDRFVAQMRHAENESVFPTGTFNPPSLEEQIGPLLVRASDIEADALLPFIPKAAHVKQPFDGRMQKLARLVARTSSVHAAACQLVSQQPWDFMAVYYSAIDDFGRYFTPSPRPNPDSVSEKDATIDRDIMIGCYRFHDMMLESLLAFAGSDTTVLLVSDHGFQSSVQRSGAETLGRSEKSRSTFGIACVHGPGIRCGESLYGATVLDITPTILTMLGLPVGNDMDGRPLLDIFAEPVNENRIKSWESVRGDAGLHAEELPEDHVGTSNAIKQLIHLEHIEPPIDNVEATISKVLRKHKINLAIALADSDRAVQAIDQWKELVEDYPDEPGFAVQLASCYMRHDFLFECKSTIDQLDGDLRQSPYVQLMMAEIHLQEGTPTESLRLAREIVRQAPQEPRLLNRIGELFLQAEAWSEAESIFQDSLALLEDNPIAHDGLARAFFEQDRLGDAVEQAQLAVGLIHCFPAAHFHLGLALRYSDREEEAIVAFETCLDMGYQLDETHYHLAVLYLRRDPVKAKRHRDLANLS